MVIGVVAACAVLGSLRAGARCRAPVAARRRAASRAVLERIGDPSRRDLGQRRGVRRARRRGAGRARLQPLTLDFDALVDEIVAEAAARTGADAVVLRVEGPGGRPVIATRRRTDARGDLVERTFAPLDARPFRAATIDWTYSASGEPDDAAVPLGARRAARRRPPGFPGTLVAYATTRARLPPGARRDPPRPARRGRDGPRQCPSVRGRRGAAPARSRRPASRTAAATRSSSGARSHARAGRAARSPSCSSASRTAPTPRRTASPPKSVGAVRATPHARDSPERHLLQAWRARVRDPAARDARVRRNGAHEPAPRGGEARARRGSDDRSQSGTSNGSPTSRRGARGAGSRRACRLRARTRTTALPDSGSRSGSSSCDGGARPQSRPTRRDHRRPAARRRSRRLHARSWTRDRSAARWPSSPSRSTGSRSSRKSTASRRTRFSATVATRLSESVGSGTVLRSERPASSSSCLAARRPTTPRLCSAACTTPAEVDELARHHAHRRGHRDRRSRRRADGARPRRARALAGRAGRTWIGRRRRSRTQAPFAYASAQYPAAKRTASGILRDRGVRRVSRAICADPVRVSTVRSGYLVRGCIPRLREYKER